MRCCATGLRLLEQKAREDEEKLAALRGLTAEGFAALDRGQGVRLEGERQLADSVCKIGGGGPGALGRATAVNDRWPLSVFSARQHDIEATLEWTHEAFGEIVAVTRPCSPRRA